MAEDRETWVVRADGLTKHFGRFAALKGISEHFLGRKLYVILGENGAGKTTLLRVMAGLAYPTRGSISVLGETQLKHVARFIGYMAHSSLLYDEMSGIENLAYFAGLYGLEHQRCREIISKLGLDPDLERPVGEYSEGMRQRLSLARALLNQPKLLLLDEPFSNVDSHSATQMVEFLGHLRDAGTTLFLVTHQPALVEVVADEFVEMRAGKIVNRRSSVEAVGR